MKPIQKVDDLTSGPPMLQCLNLVKSFGGVPVLKGVSLSLKSGTVTAPAWENGAGKSTTLKIASRQLRADQGEVSVRGVHLVSGVDPRTPEEARARPGLDPATDFLAAG